MVMAGDGDGWWVMGDGGWREIVTPGGAPEGGDVAYTVEEGAVADSVAPRPSRVAVVAGPGMVGILTRCPFPSHRTHFITMDLTPLCSASKWGPQSRPLGSVMFGQTEESLLTISRN